MPSPLLTAKGVCFENIGRVVRKVFGCSQGGSQQVHDLWQPKSRYFSMIDSKTASAFLSVFQFERFHIPKQSTHASLLAEAVVSSLHRGLCSLQSFLSNMLCSLSVWSPYGNSHDRAKNNRERRSLFQVAAKQCPACPANPYDAMKIGNPFDGRATAPFSPASCRIP